MPLSLSLCLLTSAGANDLDMMAVFLAGGGVVRRGLVWLASKSDWQLAIRAKKESNMFYKQKVWRREEKGNQPLILRETETMV